MWRSEEREEKRGKLSKTESEPTWPGKVWKPAQEQQNHKKEHSCIQTSVTIHFVCVCVRAGELDQETHGSHASPECGLQQ